MNLDIDLITAEVKKAFDTFVENIVAYIVGFLIVCIGMMFVVTIAPLAYGMYSMVLKGGRGEKVEIKDVFCGFSSVDIFIRSWIGLIGIAIVPGALAIICFVLIFVLALISPTLAMTLGMLLYFVLFICLFIIEIFLYYAYFIYIMTPSENIVYAIKESYEIGKSNLPMVVLTMIIASILSIFGITAPLGSLFALNMLKQLKPGIKDGSEV